MTATVIYSNNSDLLVENEDQPIQLKTDQADLMENIQKIIDLTVLPADEESTSTSYEGTYYAVSE